MLVTDRKVRVAQAGMGRQGRDIATAAQAAGNLELVACFDANREAATQAAADFGCRAVESFEDLLRDESVKGIVIVSPNQLHREQAVAAVKAGKHVFVEKPIANTLAEARDMVLAAREAGRWLQVGHNMRRRGAQRKMKELVEQGAIGQMVVAEANFGHSHGLRMQPGEWRWRWDNTPGGALMLLGVHHADSLSWLCGPIKRVTGFLGRVATAAEIEDAGAVALEFESGAFGGLTTGYSYPRQVHLNLYGTRGNILSDERDATITLVGPEGEVARIPAPEVDTLRDEMQDFGRCIMQGRRPETGGEEGFNALAVVWAAIESSRSGRAVEVEKAP